MNNRERGFLLLTSHLGDPHRHPLSTAQFRTLAQRVRNMERPAQQRDLLPSDFLALGYGREMAERIIILLDDNQLLDYYLNKGCLAGCIPLTWVSNTYPVALHNKLAEEAPACLWAKGPLELLQRPSIALVGCRDIAPVNYRFAREAGIQAARQGYVLVSGNARGADKAAQQACLDAGGQVISVVADELNRCPPHERVLYLSEDTFDAAFSAQRALSRNRLIHCLASRVFVAQCHHGRGGTWNGTAKNLSLGWSAVFSYADGSLATKALLDMGAEPVGFADLQDISSLKLLNYGLFDQ